MIGNVKAYDNLIKPTVDACKYLHPMSYDMITFSLLDHLCGEMNSPKLKEDGQNIADWLCNLATLAGELFVKYTVSIELHALLMYVANQLKTNQVFDLLVLKELLSKSGTLQRHSAVL